MRYVALLLIVLVSGCKPTPSEPTPPAAVPALPVAPVEPVINFEKWPTATEDPIFVDQAMLLDCVAEPTGAESKWVKLHGPHLKPAIVVRVNPEAIAAFHAKKSPMPVGTTIVKEKHFNYGAKDTPREYTAMIKREVGYDAAHGDWEYIDVRRLEMKVTRGRLESCIECHTRVSANDYLFRSYLTKPK